MVTDPELLKTLRRETEKQYPANDMCFWDWNTRTEMLFAAIFEIERLNRELNQRS